MRTYKRNRASLASARDLKAKNEKSESGSTVDGTVARLVVERSGDGTAREKREERNGRPLLAPYEPTFHFLGIPSLLRLMSNVY
jgi:hypothetical protein